MKHFMTWISAAALSLLTAQSFAAPKTPIEILNSLNSELDSLEQEFAVHNSYTQGTTLETRLQSGIALQAIGDHQRAEYIFMDIIGHEEWRSTPGYQTALYQLAVSLYEDGYYRLSQRYLIDLLKTGVGSERTDGVVLLLQVAQRTGDWAEVNTALADVSDFSRSPAYLYIMGRAMFLQGDYATARTCLQSINSTSEEWFVKAEYLLGVLDVIAQDLDSALRHFENVANDDQKYRGSDDVKALAILAQARIYYEQTQWSKAIACYQKISEKSRYFADVLYEMGWTHVRLEDYHAAQQKFELLVLAYPNDQHALETRRLQADLKRELGQYDEALASYQKIVDDFEPVMSEMEAESAQLENRKLQLQQSIEAEQYRNVQIVPERAKGLISVGSDVNRVEIMLDSLTESDDNTIESDNIIAEINAALQSDERVRNLPEFQHYTQYADDIRTNALMTGYDFTVQHSDVSEHVSQLANNAAKLPRNAREREILMSLKVHEREEREAEFHRLKLQIESLQHKTKILKTWMDSGRTSSMTENEKSQLNAQIRDYEDKLASLTPMLNSIESQIAKLRTVMSMNNTSADDRSNLDELQAMLIQQWAMDESSADAEYHQLITQDRALLNRLENFNNSINVSIQNRVSDFKARLEREAILLEAEKERYQTMKTDVGATAGEISARYWQSVYDQIRDMVLNADLGVVDIAWLQKDARSKALSTAMEERKKEREILEQDFKQFLKESGQE